MTGKHLAPKKSVFGTKRILPLVLAVTLAVGATAGSAEAKFISSASSSARFNFKTSFVVNVTANGIVEDSEMRVVYGTVVNPNDMLSELEHDTKPVNIIERGENGLESNFRSVPVVKNQDGQYYLFDNWYSDSEFQNVYNGSEAIHDDVDIYANCQPLALVSFNMMGHGTQTQAFYQVVGTAPCFVMGAHENGYTFEGWYTDDTFTEKYVFERTPVMEDITLYAKWTEIPQPTPEPEEEEQAEEPQEPAENQEPENQEQEEQKAVHVLQFDLSCDMEKPAALQDITSENDQIQIPAEIPAREGYLFKGWSDHLISQDGGVTYWWSEDEQSWMTGDPASDAAKVEEIQVDGNSLVLYAVWEEVEEPVEEPEPTEEPEPQENPDDQKEQEQGKQEDPASSQEPEKDPEEPAPEQEIVLKANENKESLITGLTVETVEKDGEGEDETLPSPSEETESNSEQGVEGDV